MNPILQNYDYIHDRDTLIDYVLHTHENHEEAAAHYVFKEIKRMISKYIDDPEDKESMFWDLQDESDGWIQFYLGLHAYLNM